jgi:HK97 family phage major capsid protein
MTTPAAPSLALEVKNTLAQIKEAQKNFASKSELDALQAKLKEQQTQLDALDRSNATRHISGNFGVTLKSMLEADEGVSRLLRDKRGKCFVKFEGPEQMAALYRKDIISATATGTSEGDPLLAVGVSTSGVLQIERTPGVVLEARQKLKLEQVLDSTPTTMAVCDFIRINTPMSVASPVAEASTKPENQLGFTSESEKIRLIAHWLPATKQVLDDLPSLMAIIQGSLLYYLNLEVELQLLAGDDSGENLHGLLPQAQAFETSLLNPVNGWTMIDVIGQAIQQINTSRELDPTFVVLHTIDYWTLRLTKDGLGRYILGDPQLAGQPSIFGLNLVYTTSIARGSFLVGSGNPAAASIRNRMEAIVEISTENQDFFVRNLIALRAERRLALLTFRPNSFVTGSFSTSPA